MARRKPTSFLSPNDWRLGAMPETLAAVRFAQGQHIRALLVVPYADGCYRIQPWSDAIYALTFVKVSDVASQIGMHWDRTRKRMVSLVRYGHLEHAVKHHRFYRLPRQECDLLAQEASAYWRALGYPEADAPPCDELGSARHTGHRSREYGA